MIFAYIAVTAFPFNYLTDSEIALNLCGIVARIGYIIYIVLHLKKLGLLHEERVASPNIILFIPLLVVCSSNFFAAGLENAHFNSIDYALLGTQIGLSFMTAIAEEIIFRKAAFFLFPDKHPLLRIFYCAAIFGAAHIVNIIPSFNPIVLLQVLYTFGLGLIVGLLYEYGGLLVACMVYHFLFNTLNNDIASAAFISTDSIRWISTNILFGVSAAIYCLSIYLIVLRKRDEVKEDAA